MNHFAVLRIVSVIVGVALTVLSFYLSYTHERQQIFQKFTSEADDVAAALELEVGRKIEVLSSYRGFYETFGYTSQEGFSALSRNTQRFHPEIVAIKWIPKILDKNRESFVERGRLEGAKDFKISELVAATGNQVTTAMSREVYYPVMYSVPETDIFPLGYDLASDIRDRPTMEIAQWNDVPITSRPVKVPYREIYQSADLNKADSKGDVFCYVVLVPVYNAGWKTENDKPEYLSAFVLGLLDVSRIFNEVIDNEFDWDHTNSIALENLTMSDSIMDRIAELPGENIDSDERVHYHKKLATIADLQWFMVAKPSKQYFAKHRSYYPYMLSLGLFIFTVLIEAYLRVLAKMDKELQEMARVDGLTGVANRRRFFDQIKKEWLRAQRFGRPISAFIIDVDNFKKYNDNYGHLEGDRCLKEVATELQAHVHRPADLLARYGGEEFAVLLPETNLEDALRVAEKCRAGIESLQIPHQHNEGWGVITVSVGVATMVPDNDNNFERILERADTEMYASKDGGRNKVTAIKKSVDEGAGESVKTSSETGSVTS